MAETTYSYQVSSNFAGGKVRPPALHAEIVAVIPTLLRVDTEDGSVSSDTVEGGTIRIVFSDALSAEDKTLLDGDATDPAGGLLAAHVPVLGTVKIYRYVCDPGIYDLRVAPVDLDYTTGLTRRLHAKRTIVLGEVTKVEWYDGYVPETDTFSDLILTVEVSYNRDAMGLPNYRDTIRTWVYEDESHAAPLKNTKKHYRGNDRTAEIKRRAENAIAMQNTLGLGLIIQDQMTNHGKTQGEAITIGLGYADLWYIFFESEIRKFEATNSRAFFDAIQALTAPDLQWAHDTPGFLAAVAAEVNLGGWE